MPLHSGSIIKTFTKQRCIRLPLLWAAPGPSRGRGCCGRGRGVPSSTRTRKSVKSTLNTVFGTMGKKLLAQGHGLLYSMGGGGEAAEPLPPGGGWTGALDAEIATVLHGGTNWVVMSWFRN